MGGLVLTGGAGRRLGGRDKALVRVDGVALAARVAAAMQAAGARDVMAVGGDRRALEALGLRWVPDRWPHQGPLGGIVSGLAATGWPWVLVCSCDLPDVGADDLRALTAAAVEVGPDVEAVVATTDGRRQPLVACVRASVGPALQVTFSAGIRSVRVAFEGLVVQEVASAVGPLRDLDTPEDLDRLAQRVTSAVDRGADVDIPQIDLETLEQWRRSGVPVLDVRNPDEYDEGHVPGAVLIPLAELPDRLDDVPTLEGGHVLPVICQAGGRSQRACEFLAAQGHEVANVTGGTGAWIEADRPTVTGTEPG